MGRRPYATLNENLIFRVANNLTRLEHMTLEADLLIENCTILPMTERDIITKGCVAVRNGRICYVGEGAAAPKIKCADVIQGSRKLAMPGLVNCHTHVAMTLFRGLAEDVPLEKWLNETIWPLEANLKSSDVYAGALLGCLEMIKSGTTCFADMYFFEPFVADAVREAGLRAVLASGIIEAGDRYRGEKMFHDAVEFAEDYQGHADGRVTTLLGPHTVFTCSEELLKKIRVKASQLGLGIHIHVAESKEMAEKVKRESGFSEIGLLEHLGFLDSDVLAAHCIHLTPEDIEIMANRKAKVAHNPVANLKLGQGVAKAKQFLDAGITVGLGTDGAASNNTLDMFESMKISALLQKMSCRNAAIFSSRDVLEMATIRGAEALGLEKKVGTLEVGKRADIILVDLRKPNLTPLHDLYGSLVYSARGCDVNTVIVEGKILMKDREMQTMDEEKIMEKAEDAASRLLEH